MTEAADETRPPTPSVSQGGAEAKSGAGGAAGPRDFGPSAASVGSAAAAGLATAAAIGVQLTKDVSTADPKAGTTHNNDSHQQRRREWYREHSSRLCAPWNAVATAHPTNQY